MSSTTVLSNGARTATEEPVLPEEPAPRWRRPLPPAATAILPVAIAAGTAIFFARRRRRAPRAFGFASNNRVLFAPRVDVHPTITLGRTLRGPSLRRSEDAER